MRLYIHDFLGDLSGQVSEKEAASTLGLLANTYRYSLDSETPRHMQLTAHVLDTLLELQDPFDTAKGIILATKSETIGCLQAMVWRPVIDVLNEEGRFAVKRNESPNYELKTMVFPAMVEHRGDFARRKNLKVLELPVLLAFHTTADKNLMDVRKLEMEVNRLFADHLSRRGRKITLISEMSFQHHFNDTPTGYLGIEKGEINPFSIIEVAKQQNMPLLTFVDSDVAKRTGAIATNFCRRTLSIRYSSGSEMVGILTARGACQDVAGANIIDGIALPSVSIVPAAKFFYRPQIRDRLDDGWTWDPAAHQNIRIT